MKRKEFTEGNWAAEQTNEFWDLFYKNEPIGSGDDELGIRFDHIIKPNKTQNIWFSIEDLTNLGKLAEKIQKAG